MISGLSLCLLLRTNSIALAIAAGVITIASKFVVRIRGKHLFNPTNFGIVAMMLLTGQVWVSPGQWGNVTIVADNPWPPFRRCSAWGTGRAPTPYRQIRGGRDVVMG